MPLQILLYDPSTVDASMIFMVVALYAAEIALVTTMIFGLITLIQKVRSAFE